MGEYVLLVGEKEKEKEKGAKLQYVRANKSNEFFFFLTLKYIRWKTDLGLYSKWAKISNEFKNKLENKL